MEKRYSVLMSLYIKEKPEYFILSVDSMLKQSILPNQIVIVKDGPITTELQAVIDRYVNECGQLFTIVELEKNVGLGLALNEGLKACRNDLVARMDTDDISVENRCEEQLKKFNEHRNLVIVGTWTHEFDDDPNHPYSSRQVPLTHDEIVSFSKRRSPFNHPTVMYKKSKILDVGGYNDILRNEDYDLFFRVLQQGFQSINIGVPLLLFRSNRNNLARRKSWVNCKGYIAVVYKMWKSGYCSSLDLLFVVVSQLSFILMPAFALQIISNKYLRTGIEKV